MDLNKASEVYDFYLEEIEKAKYSRRYRKGNKWVYEYPDEKKGQSEKKVVENSGSKITNKKESEGEKKMKTVKLDSNGESDIYEVKGEKVYFHKDKKSGSNKIVLADANTGEPVLSGTNQYLKFDSEKEASEWLNKNSSSKEPSEHTLNEIWDAYSKEELTPKKGESYEDVAKRIVSEAKKNNAEIVNNKGDYLTAFELASIIEDKMG